MKWTAVFQALKEREEGFWSSFILIFLVTLALMGMGSYILIQGEGANMGEQAEALEVDYAANGGAYFGIGVLGRGRALDEATPLSIGPCSVTLDTSEITGSENILLTVYATRGDMTKGIEIELTPGNKMVDSAIYTTGWVFNVSAKDSLGAIDSDRVVTLADSVPTIDEDSLRAISTAQGHDISGNWDAVDEWPDGSFYAPDGVTPNVTYVNGNMTVQGGRTIYGIYIVEGNVTMHGSARVQGVVYLPNVTSTVITGGGNPGESSITGGIVSHGNISGFGNHISVKHWPEFMRTFCGFQKYPEMSLLPVIKWDYI